MDLQLSLKINWFEMTKKRIKKEDYRDITPYWCNRLMTFDGKIMPKDFWVDIAKGFSNGYFYHRADFREFDNNIMTLGYPLKTDLSRIKKFKHAGIHIGIGNEAWGAIPNKIYFVIKHGDILI